MGEEGNSFAFLDIFGISNFVIANIQKKPLKINPYIEIVSESNF